MLRTGLHTSQTSAYEPPCYLGVCLNRLDALVLIETCCRGVVPFMGRPMLSCEKEASIKSGHSFCFTESDFASDMWTDGIRWEIFYEASQIEMSIESIHCGLDAASLFKRAAVGKDLDERGLCRGEPTRRPKKNEGLRLLRIVNKLGPFSVMSYISFDALVTRSYVRTCQDEVIKHFSVSPELVNLVHEFSKWDMLLQQARWLTDEEGNIVSITPRHTSHRAPAMTTDLRHFMLQKFSVTCACSLTCPVMRERLDAEQKEEVAGHLDKQRALYYLMLYPNHLLPQPPIITGLDGRTTKSQGASETLSCPLHYRTDIAEENVNYLQKYGFLTRGMLNANRTPVHSLDECVGDKFSPQEKPLMPPAGHPMNPWFRVFWPGYLMAGEVVKWDIPILPEAKKTLFITMEQIVQLAKQFEVVVAPCANGRDVKFTKTSSAGGTPFSAVCNMDGQTYFVEALLRLSVLFPMYNASQPTLEIFGKQRPSRSQMQLLPRRRFVKPRWSIPMRKEKRNADLPSLRPKIVCTKPEAPKAQSMIKRAREPSFIHPAYTGIIGDIKDTDNQAPVAFENIFMPNRLSKKQRIAIESRGIAQLVRKFGLSSGLALEGQQVFDNYWSFDDEPEISRAMPREKLTWRLKKLRNEVWPTESPSQSDVHYTLRRVLQSIAPDTFHEEAPMAPARQLSDISNASAPARPPVPYSLIPKTIRQPGLGVLDNRHNYAFHSLDDALGNGPSNRKPSIKHESAQRTLIYSTHDGPHGIVAQGGIQVRPEHVPLCFLLDGVYKYKNTYTRSHWEPYAEQPLPRENNIPLLGPHMDPFNASPCDDDDGPDEDPYISEEPVYPEEKHPNSEEHICKHCKWTRESDGDKKSARTAEVSAMALAPSSHKSSKEALQHAMSQRQAAAGMGTLQSNGAQYGMQMNHVAP